MKLETGNVTYVGSPGRIELETRNDSVPNSFSAMKSVIKVSCSNSFPGNEISQQRPVGLNWKLDMILFNFFLGHEINHQRLLCHKLSPIAGATFFASPDFVSFFSVDALCHEHGCCSWRLTKPLGCQHGHANHGVCWYETLKAKIPKRPTD